MYVRVVRYALRLVTAGKRALLLLLRDAADSPCFPSLSLSSSLPRQLMHQSMTGGVTSHTHQRTSANSINHPNTNSCKSSAPMSPSRNPASLAHAMAVAGAVADVPCQASGLPWSTIVRVAFGPRLRECERVMRARSDQKSFRNSPYSGPQAKSSTRSRDQ